VGGSSHHTAHSPCSPCTSPLSPCSHCTSARTWVHCTPHTVFFTLTDLGGVFLPPPPPHFLGGSFTIPFDPSSLPHWVGSLGYIHISVGWDSTTICRRPDPPFSPSQVVLRFHTVLYTWFSHLLTSHTSPLPSSAPLPPLTTLFPGSHPYRTSFLPTTLHLCHLLLHHSWGDRRRDPAPTPPSAPPAPAHTTLHCYFPLHTPAPHTTLPLLSPPTHPHHTVGSFSTFPPVPLFHIPFGGSPHFPPSFVLFLHHLTPLHLPLPPGFPSHHHHHPLHTVHCTYLHHLTCTLRTCTPPTHSPLPPPTLPTTPQFLTSSSPLPGFHHTTLGPTPLSHTTTHHTSLFTHSCTTGFWACTALGGSSQTLPCLHGQSHTAHTFLFPGLFPAPSLCTPGFPAPAVSPHLTTWCGPVSQ